MPLAERTDVIDQILAIALHPAFDSRMGKTSVDVILNLTQSPETHSYIVRKEVVENLLKICEVKRKRMTSEQSQESLQEQDEKEHPMVVNLLKYVTITRSSPSSLSLLS